jgi:murein DD-endopeptidase MepM/ murein hydrolase activator NlpD
MPLRLTSFPMLIPRADRVTFYNGFEADRRGRSHDAIDIGAPEGTLVLAATDGIVLRSWMSGHGPVTGAGWSPRGGFVVMMVDNDGYAHYYAHMREAPTVRPGQSFRAGGVLGQVSNSGSVAQGGPMHLHYQVWEVGSGRVAERTSGTFTRRFGRAVNPHGELARLAAALGANVSSGGRAVFDTPA